ARSRSARKLSVHTPRTSRSDTSSPRACLRAPAVFCDHVLEHLLIQAQICYQLLQPRVLLLELPEPLCVVHFHSSKLCFPRVDRVLGYSKLATYFFRAAASIGLLERFDDLRLGESSLCHLAPLSSLLWPQIIYDLGTVFGEHV